MNELGINGYNEVYKENNILQEICPQSEISLTDCEKFWDDVFSKIIPDKKTEHIATENRIEDMIEENEITFDSVKEFWNNVFAEPIEVINENLNISKTEHIEVQDCLSQAEKKLIYVETGWSDEVIDNITSIEEYKIYKEAGLLEGEVNGKKCLMRTDIDWDEKDQFGTTNRERLYEGLAPLDKTGKPIQLHHIGQHVDSPLAELTFTEHRTGGNDTILHDKTKVSEVHGEGNSWGNERKEYWRNRLI